MQASFAPPTVPDDIELLAAWRAGDRHAGSSLFSRHFEGVRRFFVNKLGSDTEDLVQRTFLICAEVGRVGFEGRSSFRTYLLGIAHNVLREHLRRRHRTHAIDLESQSIVDLAPGPSTLLAGRVEHRLLLEALRTLPLRYQILLELYFWEKLTGPELGEILGVPENTARSRVRRGKVLLREAVLALQASPTALESTATDLEKWAAELRGALLVTG
jgi:RNA polymerase sigma factor (sigma-70 family)